MKKSIYEMTEREYRAHIRHKKHVEMVIRWIIEKVIIFLLIFLIICFIGSPEIIADLIIGG